MTNTKARDEAINEMLWIRDPKMSKEQNDFVRNCLEQAIGYGFDAAIEHVLKAIGEFDEQNAYNSAPGMVTGPGGCVAHDQFMHGARRQHDQIIKKIKAASSGETRVLSDKVARGSKGDVG